MSLAAVHTGVIVGVGAHLVEVEVSIRPGIPKFTIIGLGDVAIREARDRVQSAMRRSGFTFPDQVLVNLAPAELKKEGSSLDLPIAIGILAASGQISPVGLAEKAFFGELSLDGGLKEVRGALAYTVECLKAEREEIILPEKNIDEASLITEIEVIGCRSLRQVVAYLHDGEIENCYQESNKEVSNPLTNKTFAEVCGQERAVRALTIAAAGGHNVIFIGVPGAGKSMLAERFPNILPPLTREELLEVVRIHSINGLDTSEIIAGRRPYRNPHHTISEAGLVGGGTQPKAGEVTLAHCGVLFLDEFPEFRRNAIESLREPIESGHARVTRVKGNAQFPARFQLLAAMNPCPCGRLGVPGASCGCSPTVLQRYMKKISQPILDRIDLHIELDQVPLTQITENFQSDSKKSDEVLRAQVLSARERAYKRAGKVNTFLSNEEVQNSLNAGGKTLALIQTVAEKRKFSARSYFRFLKVARTVADLDDADAVCESHVIEAATYKEMKMFKQYGVT